MKGDGFLLLTLGRTGKEKGRVIDDKVEGRKENFENFEISNTSQFWIFRYSWAFKIWKVLSG